MNVTEFVPQILQLGLLGIIFLCLVFRKWIVPEWTLKLAEDAARSEHADLTERLAVSQAQVTALQQLIATEMMPALTRATEINSKYTEELQYLRFTGTTRPVPPTHEGR